MARIWQTLTCLLLIAALAGVASPAHAADGDKKAADAKDEKGQIKRDAKGNKILKFNALEIEGDHETPNVIIIQEWTPPKDTEIKDKATDDLDRVFTGIRSLNRQFDQELRESPDVETISKEAEARKEEQRLLEEGKPRQQERSRKTSLR